MELLRFQLKLPLSLVERIDRWGAEHLPLTGRSRAEAVRRLIERGLGNCPPEARPKEDDD